MWIGEQITKRGIGNGISILIFASILSSFPLGVSAWYNGGVTERLFLPIMVIGVVVAVVFIQEGQRRIPIQYAKRMVGRRLTTGGSTYLPLRVNMAGVIPIIFAAAIMAFPPTIGQYFPSTQGFVNRHFSYTDWPYILAEAVLIVVFTYFYTAVQFNPVDQADNLRKNGRLRARHPPGVADGAVLRPRAVAPDACRARCTWPSSRRCRRSPSSTSTSRRRPRARSAEPRC